MLKGIKTIPQILPKAKPRTVLCLRHAFSGETKGKTMHRHSPLAVFKGVGHEKVDFLYDRIRHRVATNAGLITMHHDVAACAPVMKVVGIRIADVEGEMIVAGRVKLL